jgi:hypothetical protein
LVAVGFFLVVLVLVGVAFVCANDDVDGVAANTTDNATIRVNIATNTRLNVTRMYVPFIANQSVAFFVGISTVPMEDYASIVFALSLY